MKRMPRRGDVVVDHNLTFPNRGEIIGGIFEHDDNDEEFMCDAFVKYSRVLGEWYDGISLSNHWNETLNAYVLDASSESNGE